MDNKKMIMNITISMTFKILVIIVTLFSTSVLIRYIGSEANGLYSLFTSILGFLAVAELGIGTAITFSMYKPIINKDTDGISGLYYLYRKFYFIIAIVIFAAGILIMPFLPTFAKGNTGEFNLYITYFMFLVAAVITYFYAHKTSLINAYKDNYITISLGSSSLIIQRVLQIIVVILTQSFILFLLMEIILNFLRGVVTEIIFRVKYKKYLNNNKVVAKDSKKEVIKNSKAMLLQQIGYILNNTLNSVIISTFLGVIILGKYTNYITLVTGIVGILSLIFSSTTSIVGHLYAKGDKVEFKRQFNRTLTINFVVGLIAFLGFFAIVEDVVFLMFGADQIIARNIVVVISVNYFIQFMRYSVTLYKNASGIFYNDRFRPLIEGVINVLLSLIFVNILGVSGVLIATIITNLLISYTVEPFVLYKNGFDKTPKKYYGIIFSTVLIFIFAVIINEQVNNIVLSNIILTILVKGLISVAIGLSLLIIIYLIYKPFRKNVNNIFNIIKNATKKVFNKK